MIIPILIAAEAVYFKSGQKWSRNNRLSSFTKVQPNCTIHFVSSTTYFLFVIDLILKNFYLFYFFKNKIEFQFLAYDEVINFRGKSFEFFLLRNSILFDKLDLSFCLSSQSSQKILWIFIPTLIYHREKVSF